MAKTTSNKTTTAAVDALTPPPAPSRRFFSRRQGVLLTLVVAVVLTLGGALAFRQLNAGKIYPGISAEGVDLGGLTPAQAVQVLTRRVTTIQTNQLIINYGSARLSVPVAQLGVKYDAPAAAAAAMAYGRSGWGCWDCLAQKVRVLWARPTVRTVVTVDDAKLAQVLSTLTAAVTQPVSNASWDYQGQITIRPATTGRRLDNGQLVLLIADRLNRASEAPITTPVYDLLPVVGDASLAALQGKVAAYLSAPLQLTIGTTNRSVDQAQIATWISVTQPTPGPRAQLDPLSFYPATPVPKLGLDRGALAAYVAALAGQIDQAPQDAALTIADGRAVVFRPSHDGSQLDQVQATAAITTAVTATGADRSLKLSVITKQPAVREDTLNNLGIKDLISEGETYFPGSTAARLTNIRVGAAQFNGVLVKPGDTFSFGTLLGEVGPAQGYLPSLVILADHEEYQYGGGLCQVATTAYRAALLAGLPITERHNHSYVVKDYYMWPYGIQGVDATIYYPPVDLKFLNDTGAYILIQTVMTGNRLKFDFYGTKTKTGVIRGPQLLSGTAGDSVSPSSSVFYRDVLDLSGTVIKTDTVRTFYQSSLNFPITKQFN